MLNIEHLRPLVFLLGRAVAAHSPGVQATLSSDLRSCYAQPRSAAQRPDKHPNTFDEQGPVLERFRDQNQIGMNQKPVPNCLDGRLGQFRIGCSSIRIKSRSGVEFYITFVLLGAQYEVATSASILPSGVEF